MTPLGCLQWLILNADYLFGGVGAQRSSSVHRCKTRIFSQGKKVWREANIEEFFLYCFFFQVIVKCCVMYAKLLL